MEYYVVDAFSQAPFKGNPAGVCFLENAVPDTLMQSIAAENNLPETAFLWRAGDGYGLRWFTPLNEIDLCGHGTLAAAFVVFHFIQPQSKEATFHTASGTLTATRNGPLYEMLLPQKAPKRIGLTGTVLRALGTTPVEAYADRDLYLLLRDEREVGRYTPDYQRLRRLRDWLGIVITARGREVDFVSRYFCPELKTEDPVTGSSHCALAAIWGEKLQQKEFVAKQLSDRGGVLYCALADGGVKISGSAVLYLRGTIAL